ncbi:ATP-binding protein [Thermoflavimicrobium dichotomicum]
MKKYGFGSKNWPLEWRMIGWFTLLLLCIVIFLGSTFYFMLVNHTEDHVGKRALSVAQAVAEIPELRQAFHTREPWKIIQPIAEKIRQKTGAEYIVVGNRQGIRYSHPLPDRLGKKMVGGDNAPALMKGDSYISKAVGSLGPAVRGKVPVISEQGEIVGVVSVGFLLSDIQEMAKTYLKQIALIALILFVIGIMGSFALAKHIKRQIFGLEPEEISALYKERNAVIESVREGILVIDHQGIISLVNQSALDILDLPAQDCAVGKPVQALLPHTRMLEVLNSGEAELDREMHLNGREIVVNRLPIRNEENQVIGVVASFRLKSEMDQLNQELSQVKQYVEALRAQTHEFKNTLYTISGLIQLESYQEAIELITKEAALHEDHVTWVMEKFADPWMGAILIGFYNRARELKIDFIIDRESRMEKIPEHIPHSAIVSILGNLVTNAFEAVQENEERDRRVRLFIADRDDTLWFEVEDSGPGIDEKWIPHIFRQGFSTKKGTNGEKRGFGLARVKQLTTELGGTVLIEKGEWGGAIFSIALPKREVEIDD